MTTEQTDDIEEEVEETTKEKPSFGRRVVVAVVVIAFASFVANIVVDNPYTHRIIRAAVNQKVTELTHLQLDFQAVKVSVVPPGVDFYGLHVAPKISPEQAIVKASQAKIRVSMWSLFLGQPKLGLVEVTDPVVVWPPPADFPGFVKEGVLDDQPDTSTPLRWPLDFDMPVNQVVIHNGKAVVDVDLPVTIPEPKQTLSSTVIGLELDANFETWNRASVRLKTVALNVALGADSLVEDAQIEILLELGRNRLTAPVIRVQSERLNVDGTGSSTFDLGRGDRRRLFQAVDAKFDADVDGNLSVLGSIADIADTRGKFSGRSTATLRIPLEAHENIAFKATADVKAENGMIDKFRLFDSEASLVADLDGLDFTKVDLKIGEESLGVGHGRIAFGGEVPISFTAKLQSMPLTSLLDALTVSFDAFDTKITTDNLAVKGTSKPFTLSVDALGRYDSFRIDKIDQSSNKYSSGPTCHIKLGMDITKAGLKYRDSGGQCYLEPVGTAPKAPSSRQAPANAKNVSNLNLSGDIYFNREKGMDLKIDTQEFDLVLASRPLMQPFAGIANSNTRIHGPYTDLKIDNTVLIRDLVAAGVPLGQTRGNAQVDIEAKKVAWSRVEAVVTGGGLIRSPKGSLGFGPDLPIDTSIQVFGVSPTAIANMIKPFAPDAGISLAIPSVNATIKGPIKYPLAWETSGELNVAAIKLGDKMVLDQAQVPFTSGAEGWSIYEARLNIATLDVVTSFDHKRAFPFLLEEAEAGHELWTKLGAHPDDEFKIEFQSEPSAGFEDTDDHLSRLPFAGPYMELIKLAGQLQIAGKFQGTTETLQGTFDASLRNMRLMGSGMSPLKIRGFYNEGRIDLMTELGGNTLQGRLSLNLRDPKLPYDWYFNFSRFDLRPLGTAAFYDDPRNYLYLSAEWQMRGRFTDWWRSEGSLKIHDLRAEFVRDVGNETRDLGIKQEQPVELLFTKQGWYFADDRDLFLTGRYARMRLSMKDNKPPENLSIQMDSILDVSAAKEFSTRVDSARGKIKMQASIAGSVKEPQIRLDLEDLKRNPFIAATWSPVQIGLADVRPPLRNIKIAASFNNGVARIDTFQAEKGAGKVNASGSINLGGSNGIESSLDINFTDATVVYPVTFLKSFESELTGGVTLSGRGLPLRLSGDVNISRARSTKEVDIRDEIINAIRRQNFSTVTADGDPFLELDLNVTADQTININNRNLQAILSTDLQIRGNNVEPNVSGQVEVNRGKFIYKRDFEIQRGLVTFDNPVRPDPSLDILALSEVSPYRVYITVTGRASNPTVEFSVDPPTREDGSPITKLEIFVLLSRGSLPDANRAIGDTQGAATSEVVNLVMGQFEEPVERLFDLSGQQVVRNIYIDTYPSQDGNPVPRINMPLDLGEDFDVVMRIDRSTRTVSSEYQLHEGITVSGSVEQTYGDESTTAENAPADDAKLDLRFRFSFD